MQNTEIRIQTQETAYYIWERQGRPDGQALDHWLRAEAELNPKAKPRKKRSRTARSTTTKSRAKPASKEAKKKRRS